MERLRNAKILVVEDIVENRNVLGTALIDQGLIPIFACTGKEAVILAIQEVPDLVLLDISIPEMNGFEVCKVLKNNEIANDIPIVFLTAHHEITDIIKGFSLGAVDYIVKPFIIAELIQRLRTHLAHKKTRELIEKQNLDLIEKNAEMDELLTALREQNQEIERINKQLSNANESKNKLFSIIAHDLRGPISGIKSLLELVQSPEPDNDTIVPFDIMNILIDTSSSTWSLLENLLAWTSTEHGILSQEIRELNPEEVVNDGILTLSQKIKQKKLKIEIEYRNTSSCLADFKMLSTVIRNLVANAIKFTFEGGMIKIICENQVKMLKFSVIDNGIGMSDEDKANLFDETNYHSASGTGEEKGSGLGLKICKEFVHKMGGIITVKSTFGKGSVFSFTIPAVI